MLWSIAWDLNTRALCTDWFSQRWNTQARYTNNVSCTWRFTWCVSLAQFTGHSAALNIRILHSCDHSEAAARPLLLPALSECLPLKGAASLKGSKPLPFVCTDCPNPFQAVTWSLWFSGIMWSLCDSAQVRKSRKLTTVFDNFLSHFAQSETFTNKRSLYRNLLGKYRCKLENVTKKWPSHQSCVNAVRGKQKTASLNFCNKDFKMCVHFWGD